MIVDFKIQNLSLWRLQKHSGIKNKRTKVHPPHLENKKNGRRALHKRAPLTARKQRMVGFSSSTPSSPSCYYNGGLNNHTRCLRNRQHRQRRTRATSALRSSSSSSGSTLDFFCSGLGAALGRPTSLLVSPDSSNRSTRSLFLPEVGKSLRMHSAFSFATVNVDATSSLMTEPQPSPVAYPFQGWRSMCALNVQFRTRIDSALNLRVQRSFHLGP